VNRQLTWALVVIAASASAACEDAFNPTAPFPGSMSILALAGDRQQTSPNSSLLTPLQVQVTHAGTGDPVSGVTIAWRINSPSDARLVSPTSLTDARGIATATVQLGATVGPSVVEASFTGLQSPPARFTVFAVEAASINTIRPSVINAGDTILLEGRGFSERPEDHLVLFDGLPAAVTAVSPTGLRVVTPSCLPTRTFQVVVQLGTVPSKPVPVNVVGRVESDLQLGAGTARLFTAGTATRCLGLNAQPGASYLLIPYNTREATGATLPFQLGVMMGAPDLPLAGRTEWTGIPATAPINVRWEKRLRSEEQALWARIGAARPEVTLPSAHRPTVPRVGEERSFNVFTWEGAPRRVKAIARTVSAHAVIYQDVEAPGGGFSDSELAALAQSFDDPIYPTDVAVFGGTSDVDANGRVTILLTPAVNRLTLPSDSGFIAGFTSFCDLLASTECTDSNVGELLYALVPDPEGRFGRRHTKDDLVRRLPGVIAHEFAHMIHFNQRMLVRKARDFESVWLSEALAHAAEDTIARVLRSRGQTEAADRMVRSNYMRAGLYLADPGKIGLPYGRDGDSLEGRGAAWLFLDYLTARYGGGLLKQLAAATEVGSVNVAARVRESWNNIVGDWVLALYADDAPELAGYSIDARYTYPNRNLRADVASVTSSKTFTLKPRVANGDFVLSGTMAPSSAAYVMVGSEAAGAFAVSLSGPRGAGFAADARANIWVLRVK
jgi:hypothetical protein